MASSSRPFAPIVILAALVVTVAALLGQSQSARDALLPDPGTGSISGRVLSAETGDPLRNARITALSSTGVTARVRTDRDGRFLISGLAAGRYRVTAAKAGYSETAFKRQQTIDGADDVDVAAGSGVSRLEIRMPRAAAISGRATDRAGEPIALAAVVAELAVPGRPPKLVKIAETDDLGDYRIGGLPAGNMLVSVRAVLDEWIAIPFNPGDRASGNFGWKSFFLDASGTPFEGEFNGAMSPRLYYPGGVPPDRAQPIVIGPGDEQSAIDFTIARGTPRVTRFVDSPPFIGEAAIGTGVIRGRIVDTDGRPLSRTRVRLEHDRTLFGSRVTTTAEDGVYEFPRLAAGAYTITASRPGYLTLAYGQAGPSASGERLWIDEGSALEHVDIALQRHGVIAGRVLDEYDDPVEGAVVRVFQNRFVSGRRRLVDVSGPVAARTNDLGAYRIFNLKPGSFVVRAETDSLGTTALPDYLPTYFPGTTDAAGGALVRVGQAQETAGIDLALKRGRTSNISGRALDSEGHPWAGAITLSASERSRAMLTTSIGARIDKDGTFIFPDVAPGEYVVRIFRGRRSPHTEDEFGAQFVTAAGTDVTGLVVQASAGSSVRGRITLDGVGEPSREDIELSLIAVDPDVSPAGTGEFANADIHDDWTFTISGIHGPRRMRVVRAPAGWGLKSILSGGNDVTDSWLSFGPGPASHDDFEVILTDRITRLTATAADARGRPVADYTVVLFAVDRERWNPGSRFVKLARSSRNGSVAIEAMPPADYYIAAVDRTSRSEDVYDDGWQEPAYLETLIPHAVRVMLTEGLTASVSLTVAR